MNWIDAIIIVIVLVFMIFGIKKGFMFSVIDIFSITVNFVISLFFTKYMRGFLNLFKMESAITNKLYVKYAGLGEGFTTDLIEYSKNGNVTDFVNDAFNSSSLGKFSTKLFNGTINNKLSDKLLASQNQTVSLADIMSRSVAQFITVVVSFAVCFALIYLLLLLLKKLSARLQKSSFVNTFDKIFGAGFGIIKGFLFIVSLFVVLSFFSDNGILSSVISYINESALGSWLRSSVNTFMIEYIDIKQFILDIINKV